MRIVHVCHHYWPVVGGIENVVKALAESMARLGHEVHVVASTYGAGGRPREEVVNGVYVHRVKAVRLRYPDLTYPLDHPASVLRNADVVHGHSQNSLFTVKIIEKAKKLGVKTVMHFMAVDAFGDHPNPLIRLLAPYYGKWMLQRAIEASDVKLVRSRRDQEILERKYGVNTVYVPDGVSEELLKKPDMANEFRTKYGIHEPFIVYIGRLHTLKGINVLIKAMSIVSREMPELKAVIIGPGDQRPFRELVRKLGIEKNAVFLGFVDENTKIGALDASIALVLPSVCNYVEVYPMVISEAWARGKPVIASAVGGVPYRVKHGVSGFLFKPGDARELAKLIMIVANNEDLAKRMGETGISEVFSWEEIARKSLEVYAL
mgnify:FL=1